MLLLRVLCGLILNILGTCGREPLPEKLILEVNGTRISEELIKLVNDKHDIRHKNITAERNLNITCKFQGNELSEPSFKLRTRTNPGSSLQKEKLELLTTECQSHPCKSASIQINPLPGSTLTCQTSSSGKMFQYALIFTEKSPSVTVAINNKSLAVGPEQKELTYKFHQNEYIVANCTHNTKAHSGIWNFSGYSNKKYVRKISETSVGIKLTSEINNSYIDCEDRSNCEGGKCQPAFVRVTFVAKVSGKEKGEDNQVNMLYIKNNDGNTVISGRNGSTIERFHYKDNDKIDITCYKTSSIPFPLRWYKNNIEISQSLTDSSKHLSLNWNSTLHEKDDGVEFKCTLDEELGNPGDFKSQTHYESIIKLQYDRDVAASLPSTGERGPSNINTIIYGSIGLLFILIIIVLLIILFIIIRSRKHKSEDELRLKTPNSSIKSQSFESVVKLNDTYSNPRDANQEIPADNSIYETDKAYSIPFSETKEVYALPVPKKFRTNKPKVEIDVNEKDQYYSYAKANFRSENSNRYENSKQQYENCNSIGDGQNSLYSEINPYL